MNKIKERTKVEIAYLAGFLDGDGCINVQLVRRGDYLLKYQIRVSVSFTQKTSRHWYMHFLDGQLGCGTIRKRKDGISEYAVVGVDNVKIFLEAFLPYLRIKKPQATLVLKIMGTTKKGQTVQEFLESCKLVDQIADLNDSKKRTITFAVVQKELESLADVVVPVETAIVTGDQESLNSVDEVVVPVEVSVVTED